MDRGVRLAITGLGLAVQRAANQPVAMGRGGQPWREKKWGAPAVPLGRLTIAFDVEIDAVPQGVVQIAMERPEHFTVTLNGRVIPASSVNGWWVDTAFQTLAVPAGVLQQGKNELLVATDYRKDTNTEPLYLVGNFGVKIDGARRIITTLPATLYAGDISTQGLPFYRGELVYKVPVAAKAAPGQRVFLETPRFGAACVRVTSARGTTQVLGWKPFKADITGETGTVAVSAMLTGQNAFGTLGGRGAIPPAAGAGAGARGGATARTAQVSQPPIVPTIPAGLLESPVITVEVRK